ncbi:hypothetical protein L6452_26785 [Arctium lappa]|uniref:Uncharacterized protein n=1 Tax=Arctium lappa TaxID=4217 RepID=A0ACB8ZW41_ARCLA|nr:hypothetical protein L6452_26785 [Arctium lappa]
MLLSSFNSNTTTVHRRPPQPPPPSTDSCRDELGIFQENEEESSKKDKFHSHFENFLQKSWGSGYLHVGGVKPTQKNK